MRQRHYERYGSWINPQYTDVCVILGPNLRWVEDDFHDLWDQKPEVLLGYRIRLATPETRLWGYRISKLVIVGRDAERSADRLVRAARDATAQVMHTDFGKVEEWHVHRVRGIWRVS